MRVLQGLYFYPRGGSAYAVRETAASLAELGCRVSVVAGSLGPPGSLTHASAFFGDALVGSYDYDAAAAAFDGGGDAMAGPLPMHGSYEDKPEAPDQDFAKVPWPVAERQVAAWQRILGRVDGPPDICHLHHLTPLTVAALRTWPERPVVTSLHGTELKWLERWTSQGATGDAAAWLSMMREIAAASRRVIALSSRDAATARRTLGISADQLAVVNGGADTALFRPIALSEADRHGLWRQWLVEDQRATDGAGELVRYALADVERLGEASNGFSTLLLSVGRYISAKRLPLLVRAYGRARALLDDRCPPLVIWGGRHDEVEGEHPVELARSLGLESVYFTGARAQSDLALALNCSALMPLPSVNESFGQVYFEALACGVPIVATTSGGPYEILSGNPDPVGWFVAEDDEVALAEGLAEAMTDAGERARR